MIDPHNEYAACFEDRAHVVRPGNLRLPYWLFNFDEMQEIIFGRRSDVEDEVGLLAELIPLAKNEYARKAAVTRPPTAAWVRKAAATPSTRRCPTAWTS